MDIKRIHAVLEGTVELYDLSVAERLALAHEVVRAELRRPVAPRATPVRFTVPEAVERLYRGTSS